MNAWWSELKDACWHVVEWFAPCEQTQWDMAASNMALEGYTEFDIRLTIGPRPEPKND